MRRYIFDCKPNTYIIVNHFQEEPVLTLITLLFFFQPVKNSQNYLISRVV